LTAGNRIAAIAVALGLLGSFGCATYADRIENVRGQVQAGNLPGAIGEINKVLGVDSQAELPDDWDGDRPLAVLERGALLQAVNSFGPSSRDLSAGENQVELLDFRHDTAGQIGSFIYSDSSRNYEMPPTERLALNAVNMLNFLTLNDWNGASVEARRFTIMRDYLTAAGVENQGLFGSYLSGLTFERLGQGDRALRYYEEAMANSALESLREPVRRLAARNPYRGPRIRELLGDAPASLGSEAPTEIITVLSLGRVPRKVPERMPIGAAIGLAGTFITGNPEVLARSVFKVVVYPELVESGSRIRSAEVRIDGNKAPVERLSSMGADIRKEYELLRPRIIAAALTRMIARALAAEGARVAGRQASPVICLLAALATEATLVSLDRPDTRSWTMLADHIMISRTVVKPGTHHVKVLMQGGGVSGGSEFDVTVPKGRAVVVVVTDPR
jgi:hypothetical protein